MARSGYFFGSLKPTNKKGVERQTTQREGMRASADSHCIGGTVRASYSAARDGNIITFDLDGGTSYPERMRLVDAWRNADGTGAITVVPCTDLLRATSDDTWSKIFQEEPEFARRLAALLFANMDAVQRG